MDIPALIAALKRQGFQLMPRGDKLAVSPASKLTPELTEILRTYKNEILKLLRSASMPARELSVVHHQDPDPCQHCGQRVWWVNPYYVPVCQNCHPASSPEMIVEWLRPQMG
jgi:hypothetical protein